MISTKPLVAVIGSSVALGCYAPDQKGWTWMLGQHLRSVGFDFENLSISGI